MGSPDGVDRGGILDGALLIRPGEERRLHEFVVPTDAERIAPLVREVADTGEPVVRRVLPLHAVDVPDVERNVALSVFPVREPDGRMTGVAVVFVDVTEQEEARRRLELLHTAATGIRNSLDVRQAAEDLVSVLVPAFADMATVELASEVLVGDEPVFSTPDRFRMHRVAVAHVKGAWPEGVLGAGAAFPGIDVSENAQEMIHGSALLLSDPAAISAVVGGDTDLLRRMMPEGVHSVISVPLFARGVLLGSATVGRINDPSPYTVDDVSLLEEIASRSALSVDNARRYTREHRAALSLQRTLRPTLIPLTPAAESAGVYRPAVQGAGIGADWYDLVPLSSLRVAFVVGDVPGHGLNASATMGRVRTAIVSLADMDLEPAELLASLNDLVTRLAPARLRTTDDSETPAEGATCLYAVYDPVSRTCSMASAGHPPPLLRRPDGTTAFVDVTPGPPLGIGTYPYEGAQFELEPGSVLAFYTDGLVARHDRDLDEGMAQLRRCVGSLPAPSDPTTLHRMAASVVQDMAPDNAVDDVALLLARTRAVPDEDTASWVLPADPSVVVRARQLTRDQLTAWDLEDLAFTTELIVSELVTNAIRYAGGPISLRLIRSTTLICEVSDPSNTQPRLRRARLTDEGGRGLYLVASLAKRWGSRYAQSGKTIWAQQDLSAPDVPSEALELTFSRLADAAL